MAFNFKTLSVPAPCWVAATGSARMHTHSPIASRRLVSVSRSTKPDPCSACHRWFYLVDGGSDCSEASAPAEFVAVKLTISPPNLTAATAQASGLMTNPGI